MLVFELHGLVYQTSLHGIVKVPLLRRFGQSLVLDRVLTARRAPTRQTATATVVHETARHSLLRITSLNKLD